MAITSEGYIVDQGLTVDNDPILKISMPIDPDTGEYFSPIGYLDSAEVKNLPHNIQSNYTIYKENINCKTFIFGYAQARKDDYKCELKTLNSILFDELTHVLNNISMTYVPWMLNKHQVFFKKTDGILHNIGHKIRPPMQLTYDIHTTYTRILFGIIKYNEEGLKLSNTCLDPHDTCIPARVKQIVKIPFTNKFYRIDYTEVLLYAKKVHAAFEIIQSDDAEIIEAESEINLITGFDYIDNTPIVTLEPSGTKYIDLSVRYPGDLDTGCLVTSGSYTIEYIDSINVINLGNIAFLTEQDVIKVDIIDYYDGIYDDYYYNNYLDECLTSFEIVSGFYFQTSRFKLTNLIQYSWVNYNSTLQIEHQPPVTSSFYIPASEIDYRNDEIMQEIYAYAPIEIYTGLKGEYSEYAGAIAELSMYHEGGVKKAKRNDLLFQGSLSDDIYERYERDDFLVSTIRVPEPRLAIESQILYKNTRKLRFGKTTIDLWWKVQQIFISKLQPIIHKRFRDVHSIGLEHWMYPLQLIDDLIEYKESLGLTTTCLADANDEYNAVIDNGGTEEEALAARESKLNECFFGELAASHRADGPISEILYNRQDTGQLSITKSFNDITTHEFRFIKMYNLHVNVVGELYNKLYAAGEMWIESKGLDFDCSDVIRYTEIALEAIKSEVKSIGVNFKRLLAEIIIRVKFNLGVPAFPKFIKFTFNAPTSATNVSYTQPSNSELRYNIRNDLYINHNGYEFKNDMNSITRIKYEIPEDTELLSLFSIGTSDVENLCIRLGKLNDLTHIQIFKPDGTHVYGSSLSPDKAQLFFSTNSGMFNEPTTYPNTGIAALDAIPYLPYVNALGSLNATSYENDGVGQIFINQHDIFYEDVVNYPTKYGFYSDLALEKYHQLVKINEVINEELIICVSGKGLIDVSIEYLRTEALWIDEFTGETIGKAPIELLNDMEIAYDEVWHKEGWILVPSHSKYSMPSGSVPFDLIGTKYEKYVDDLYEKCFQDNVTILDPLTYVSDKYESTTWTPFNEQKHLYTNIIPGKVHQIHVLNYCNRIECDSPKVGPVMESACAKDLKKHKCGFLEDELKTSGSRCFYNDTLSRKSGEIVWGGSWYDTLAIDMYDSSNETDCYDFCLNQATILFNDAIDNGVEELKAATIKSEFLNNCINNQNSAAPDCYYKCILAADVEEINNINEGVDPFLARAYKLLTIANCFPSCIVGGCLSECMQTALLLQIESLKNGDSIDAAELIYWQAIWNCSDVCTSDCSTKCKDDILLQYDDLLNQGLTSDEAITQLGPDLKACYLVCDPTNMPPECDGGGDGDEPKPDPDDDPDPDPNNPTSCLIELYKEAMKLYDMYGDPDSPDYNPNWVPEPVDPAECYYNTTYCISKCVETYNTNITNAIAEGYDLVDAMSLYNSERGICYAKCSSGDCYAHCAIVYDKVVVEYYDNGYSLEESFAAAYDAQVACLQQCLKVKCIAQCAKNGKNEYVDNIQNGMDESEALLIFETSVSTCITEICNILPELKQCVIDCLKANLLEYMDLLEALNFVATDELEDWYDTVNNDCYIECLSTIGHVTVKLKLYHFTTITNSNELMIGNRISFNTIGYEVPDIKGAVVKFTPEIIEKPNHPYYIYDLPTWYEILKISLVGGYSREIHAKSVPSRAVMHYKFFMPEKVQFEENRNRFFSRSSKYQRTMMIKPGSSLLQKSKPSELNPYLEYLETEGWVTCIDNQTDFEKVYDILFLSNLKVIGYYDYDDIFNKNYSRLEYNILNFLNVSKICYITIKPDLSKYTINQIKYVYKELMNRLELFFGKNIKIGIMFDYTFPTDVIEELYTIDIFDKVIFDANSDEDVANIWDNHGLATYGNDIVFMVTLTKIKDYKIQEMFDRWRISYNYNELIINDSNSFIVSQTYTNYKNTGI